VEARERATLAWHLAKCLIFSGSYPVPAPFKARYAPTLHCCYRSCCKSCIASISERKTARQQLRQQVMRTTTVASTLTGYGNSSDVNFVSYNWTSGRVLTLDAIRYEASHLARQQQQQLILAAVPDSNRDNGCPATVEQSLVAWCGKADELAVPRMVCRINMQPPTDALEEVFFQPVELRDRHASNPGIMGVVVAVIVLKLRSQ